METISIIFQTICRIIYAIVGGAISIAFIIGATSAVVYALYTFIRYGYNGFVNEFLR